MYEYATLLGNVICLFSKFGNIYYFSHPEVKLGLIYSKKKLFVVLST